MVVFWLRKKITSDDSVKLDFGSSDVKYVADGDKQNAVSFDILQTSSVALPKHRN